MTVLNLNILKLGFISKKLSKNDSFLHIFSTLIFCIQMAISIKCLLNKLEASMLSICRFPMDHKIFPHFSLVLNASELDPTIVKLAQKQFAKAKKWREFPPTSIWLVAACVSVIIPQIFSKSKPLHYASGLIGLALCGIAYFRVWHRNKLWDEAFNYIQQGNDQKAIETIAQGVDILDYRIVPTVETNQSSENPRRRPATFNTLLIEACVQQRYAVIFYLHTLYSKVEFERKKEVFQETFKRSKSLRTCELLMKIAPDCGLDLIPRRPF